MARGSGSGLPDRAPLGILRPDSWAEKSPQFPRFRKKQTEATRCRNPCHLYGTPLTPGTYFNSR